MTAATLSPADIAHARAIAAWLIANEVNSNGGCGVSLRNQKPAAVAFPNEARLYEEARHVLQWRYTSLPFEIARKMSSIPTLAAWANKRACANDPPLVGIDRARALHAFIESEKTRYSAHIAGYCNASAANVLDQLRKDLNL